VAALICAPEGAPLSGMEQSALPLPHVLRAMAELLFSVFPKMKKAHRNHHVRRSRLHPVGCLAVYGHGTFASAPDPLASAGRVVAFVRAFSAREALARGWNGSMFGSTSAAPQFVIAPLEAGDAPSRRRLASR
jgi:hypothetical protein